MSAMQDNGSVRWAGSIIWPAGLAMAAALCCWAACGASLSLFIGPILFVAILAPPLALQIHRPPWAGISSSLAIVAVFSLLWLGAMIGGVISIGAWIWCVLVLTTF